MIRVGDLDHYESLSPAGKLLALVFAMVGKDRATELWFGCHPDPPQVRMGYVVGAVPYEMVPPPGHLWPDLFRLLWRQTRLQPSDRPPWWHRLRRQPAFPDVPAAGTLTVRFGNVPVDFDILFFRGPIRQYVQLRNESPAYVASISAEFLSHWMERHAGPDGTIDL